MKLRDFPIGKSLEEKDFSALARYGYSSIAKTNRCFADMAVISSSASA